LDKTLTTTPKYLRKSDLLAALAKLPDDGYIEIFHEGMIASLASVDVYADEGDDCPFAVLVHGEF
jgi:hypothetical protein